MNRTLFTLLIGLVLLSACSGAPDLQKSGVSTQPVVPIPTASLATSSQPTVAAKPSTIITDALGREVTLSNPPRRIVITGKALIMVVDAVYMFPEAPERIAALGNAGQGTSNFISLIDPSYAAKATLQQDAGVEQIAAAKPDLVILKSYLAGTLGKSIEVLNIPVVYVDFETPEQYERDLAILGKVFQNETRAQQIAAFYQNKVAEIQTALQGVNDKPRVLMLYYTDTNGAVAFNVPPMAWMQTQIVKLAGGEPVWSSANPANGWTKVTLEQIAAWDADQIFIISYLKNPSDVVAGLKTDPQWKALRAVRQMHLYAFPGDLYSWDQPDARWNLGLSWLAARLHPDRFSKFDIVQEAQQFYQTLYGLDAQFFEKNIHPTFKGDLP
jgi:iron complex transport system substrate-binding protein